MGINFIDIAAITTPLYSGGPIKNVSQIADSNGNVMWRSHAFAPYRLLEYIKFSGAEYIDTGIQTKVGYAIEVTFSIDDNTTTRQMILSCLNNSAASNESRRFYLGDLSATNGLRCCMGNTWTTSGSYSLATYFPNDTKRKLYCTCANVNSKPTMYWGLNDGSGNTLISLQTLTQSTTEINSPNTSLYLMAGNNSNRSVENCTSGKVYGLTEQKTNRNTYYTHIYLPVQRKSDNVCGLYDIISDTFLPMQGTEITTNAAGPIIDQYWDKKLIEELDGETFLFKNSLNIEDLKLNVPYVVAFSDSSNTEYDIITKKSDTQLYYDQTLVYNNGWVNNNYKTIHIIQTDRSTDNDALYNFLIKNSNIKNYVTSLFNTIWLFNDTLYDFSQFTTSGKRFFINFSDQSSPATNYQAIMLNSNKIVIYEQWSGGSITTATTVYNNGTWFDTDYKTINITNGTDATNKTIMKYLRKNATLQ